MNPRNLSKANLVDFARSAIAAITDGKITGLSPAQAAEIVAALTAAADGLDTATEEQVKLRAAYMEGNEIGRDRRETLIRVFANLKSTMSGIEAPDDQYDAVGFDPPAPHAPVKPQTPTGLAVKRKSDGSIILVYSGNNTPGRVVYSIEAKIDGEYRLIGTTTRQKFKLETVIPGKPYRYRVYAQSTRLGRSGYSNETVV